VFTSVGNLVYKILTLGNSIVRAPFYLKVNLRFS